MLQASAKGNRVPFLLRTHHLVGVYDREKPCTNVDTTIDRGLGDFVLELSCLFPVVTTRCSVKLFRTRVFKLILASFESMDPPSLGIGDTGRRHPSHVNLTGTDARNVIFASSNVSRNKKLLVSLSIKPPRLSDNCFSINGIIEVNKTNRKKWYSRLSPHIINPPSP